MSFKSDFFKNILILGGYAYSAQLISFLSTVILSRLLSPQTYGITNLITLFIGFIMVFADGGLSYALIRNNYGETFNRVFMNISIIFGIVLCLITVLMAYPISLFFNSPEIKLPIIIYSSVFLIKGFSLTQESIIAKRLNFAFIGKATVISIIISTSFAVILALFGATYWALISAQLLNAFSIAVIYQRKVKLGFKIFPVQYLKVVFRKIKKTIKNVIGFNAINYWARNADNLIVGKFYGQFDLGIYNRAYSLLMLPLNLITGLISRVLYPSLKKLKMEGGDIEKEYTSILKIIPLITFPLVLLFILFPTKLILLLWGAKWLKVADFLPYFGLLIYTQTLLSTVGQLLVLQGKEKEFLISGWVNAFFLISGIIWGAIISLIGVAQFYSLFYLVFVLIINVIYIYISVLGFNSKNTLLFWVPKIFISIVIWFSIYYQFEMLKFMMLLVLFIEIIINLATYFRNISFYFNKK